MHKFIAILCSFLISVFILPTNANAQHRGPGSGGVVASPFPIPPPTAPSTYRGGLVPVTFNATGFSAGTVQTIQLLEANGPLLPKPYTSFLSLGFPALGSSYMNIKATFPSITGGFNNDRAASAIFSGALKGSYFTFYDDPDGLSSDDWMEIFFYQDIPVGQSYYLYSFQGTYDYTDQYVSVRYHYVNGLDGKVSGLGFNRKSGL